MRSFDVIVIGSGAAGQTVAEACASAGKSVAVADRRPFGGTCSLRGCIPKKVLYAGAQAVARSAMLQGKGVARAAEVSWPELMAFKRSYTEPVPDKTETWMAKSGIETLHGTARFESADVLVVDGERYGAEAFVIATGARPAPLGIPGEEHVRTSEDFLDLDELPGRVAFVGGGYISFEFAGIAHHAGAHATIVHRSDRVLEGFDPRLTALLAEHYRAMGVDVRTGSPVERVERDGDAFVVVTPSARIEADLVVHGAGRMPDLDDLDLDVAGVERERHGVSVDARLHSTSNPRVWAVGDAAAPGLPLTPVAGAQGEVVAANILGGDVAFDGAATASVVFSDPPLASVGAGASDVEGDDRYDVRFSDMGRWFTQTYAGNDTGGAVLVIDKAAGTIAGAHLLGLHADEVINVFTLAVKFGLTIEQLKTVSWSYPSLSYDINYLTGRY